MRSTAIERAPAFAPAIATGPRERTDHGFANVLARCSDGDASVEPHVQADDDDDVPMLDDADVVAEDASEAEVSVVAEAAVEADPVAQDDTSSRELDVKTIDDHVKGETATNAQPEVAIVASVPIEVAIREPVASAPVVPDTNVNAPTVARSDASTLTSAVATSVTARASGIRRPTPADGTDARARASIASQDAVVTGVPMRTDGGVRVDLRAPVVASATTPLGGVATVVNRVVDASAETVAPETVAHETVAHETVAHETIAHETVARESTARDTVARGTVTRESTVRETVGRETAVIEHAPVANAPRTAVRSGGERRGPITFARTDATPSPRTNARAPAPEAPLVTPNAPTRDVPTANDTKLEDPLAMSASEPTAAAPTAAAPSASMPTEAAPRSDAPVDALATAPSDPSSALPPTTTTSDPLAPPPSAPLSDAPTTTRTAPPPTADAPVVLTRAEDLAHAIEKLKPIPRGGATLEVETPGMGQLRLHVRVEDGVVKVRIHAGSEAAASWLAQERDGLTAAARNAVGSALGIELDLRGGTNDTSDRRPARDATPTPLPYAGTAPRSSSAAASSSTPPPSTRARGLVDVLA